MKWKHLISACLQILSANSVLQAVSDLIAGLLAQPLYILLIVIRSKQNTADGDTLASTPLLVMICTLCTASHLGVMALSLDSFLTAHLHLRYQEPCWCNDLIRDLKQLGRQRQGRRRLKNEFLFLIRFSEMAARIYHLIRRHNSTST